MGDQDRCPVETPLLVADLRGKLAILPEACSRAASA
jgi:hypothetical protein